MSTGLIANLEKLIGTARDGALLRYSLGSEYFKAGDRARAIVELREALARDAAYSAAWKLLGKALSEEQEPEKALQAFERGIEAAEAKGDRQAAKEMRVFAQRLRKQNPEPAG